MHDLQFKPSCFRRLDEAEESGTDSHGQWRLISEVLFPSQPRLIGPHHGVCVMVGVIQTKPGSDSVSDSKDSCHPISSLPTSLSNRILSWVRDYLE